MQDINPQQHQPTFLPNSTIRWGRVKSGGELDKSMIEWVRDTNTEPSVSEYYRRAGWGESADLMKKAEELESGLKTGDQVPQSVSDLRDIRAGLKVHTEKRVEEFKENLVNNRITCYLYRDGGKKMFAVRTAESIYAIAQLDIRTETLVQAGAQIMVKYAPPCQPIKQPN